MSPNLQEEKLDPRVKRTRNLIQQGFMDLLAEKGFQTISVQDITERAEINRATFYAHFPDKYALLDHSIREAFRSELESRVLNACHFSMENLHMLILTVCEFVEYKHTRCATTEAQYQSLIEAQIRAQIYELILYWLSNKKNPLPYSVSPEQAATAASWALYGLAYERTHLKPAPPAEQFTQQVQPLIAAILGEALDNESAHLIHDTNQTGGERKFLGG